jgi:arginine/lysine/ornithine decarboxylase
MFMREQFERGIRSNRMRLKYLCQHWQKELDVYRNETIKACAKSKDKTLKEKLVKPLTKISVPRSFFKQFIYRCKVVHSLAFF